MSKYHSICETCGMEDPNDGTLEEDCGHPLWIIVIHEEGKDEPMTDTQAMNELAEWLNNNDPSLDESLPNWVWSLTALIDDLLIETGRLEDEEDIWGGDTVTESEYGDWIEGGRDAD